jgi:hypothetical protein
MCEKGTKREASEPDEPVGLPLDPEERLRRSRKEDRDALAPQEESVKDQGDPLSES